MHVETVAYLIFDAFPERVRLISVIAKHFEFYALDSNTTTSMRTEFRCDHIACDGCRFKK